jgi:hypothetical protein
MYGAREQFASDREFGQWLKDYGYDFYNKNDRAALVAMGSDIPTMRAVLTKTTFRSYQLIWRENKARFPIDRKTDQASGRTGKKRVSKPRKTQRRTPKRTSKARKYAIRKEILGDFLEAGKRP